MPTTTSLTSAPTPSQIAAMALMKLSFVARKAFAAYLIVSADAGSVRLRAGAAVVAAAPNLTGAIRFEPPLPAWRLRLEQAVSQGSVTKILAVYEQPFWRAEGLSGEGFAPYELVRELYDNTPPSASVGVLCTSLAGEVAEEAGRMSAGARRLVENIAG